MNTYLVTPDKYVFPSPTNKSLSLQIFIMQAERSDNSIICNIS